MLAGCCSPSSPPPRPPSPPRARGRPRSPCWPTPSRASSRARGRPGWPSCRARCSSARSASAGPRCAALALDGGADALAGVRLEVGRPLQPMLASAAADLEAAFAHQGPAAVEWKLDGARIQVHRSGSEVAVFTRTLDDVTARLPEVVA